MKNNNVKKNVSKKSKELALHYMSTLIDVARESFLILDSKLRVVSGNPIFYKIFRVLPEETENIALYKLGNGQWDIAGLKKLMEEILPNKKVVKNYKVRHVFEGIGKKTMLLNARQIDAVQLIILAIEDITVAEENEEKIANYTKDLEANIAARTADLAEKIEELESVNESMVGREIKMVELKKEIKTLKKLLKKGNGKNGNGFSKSTTSRKNGKGRNGNGKK